MTTVSAPIGLLSPGERFSHGECDDVLTVMAWGEDISPERLPGVSPTSLAKFREVLIASDDLHKPFVWGVNLAMPVRWHDEERD